VRISYYYVSGYCKCQTYIMRTYKYSRVLKFTFIESSAMILTSSSRVLGFYAIQYVFIIIYKYDKFNRIITCRSIVKFRLLHYIRAIILCIFYAFSLINSLVRCIKYARVLVAIPAILKSFPNVYRTQIIACYSEGACRLLYYIGTLAWSTCTIVQIYE